jgi:putative DNA primase/helicase
MPRLALVTYAIRRRMQMVPFRAVFEARPGPGMRERLKAEAGGSILDWVIGGAREWLRQGSAPPACVRELTEEYLEDQDVLGQWLDECCERVTDGFELSSALHTSHKAWAQRVGIQYETNRMLSTSLVAAGFRKDKTMIGRVFRGIRIRQA